MKVVISVTALIAVLLAVAAVYWAIHTQSGAKTANGPRDVQGETNGDTAAKTPKLKKLTKADYMPIYKGVLRPKRRPVFQGKSSDNTNTGTKGPGKTVISAGKYTLFGIIGDNVLRSAVFRDAADNQRSTYPGDVLDNIKIIEVRPREVIVEVNGVRNSWLTVDTNSFFICSIRLRSDISFAIIK